MRFWFARSANRLWLAETTSGAIETAGRSPEIDELLKFWAREIAGHLRPVRVALFIAEGVRWIRILPEGQVTDVPFLSDSTLAGALMSHPPTSIAPVTSKDPRVILWRFAAPTGWRGVLALWADRSGALGRSVRQADGIATAIGRSLNALRRSEAAREQAIALERSRWAAELHDGHLQTLSSVKLHAEVCQSLERQHRDFCNAFPQGSGTRLESELARMRDLVAETIREARQFLLELRSPPVTADQFLPWLKAFAEDFGREAGLRTELRVEGEGTLPQSQVEEGTRLIREALINIRKHAKAGTVRIVVAFSEEAVSISISDDGVGFDVRDTMERLLDLDSSHNGLIGSRYRAESIGGEMHLRSEIGKGTTVRYRLPKAARRPTLTRRAAEPLRKTGARPPVAASASSVLASIRSTLHSTMPFEPDEDAPEPQSQTRPEP